jgi:hypothetical protein
MSELNRGASAMDKPIKSVAIARVEGMDPDRAYAVTAAVTTGGHLRLALWRVAFDAETIVRERANSDDRVVNEVALLTASALTIVAAINGQGILEVSTWGPDLAPQHTAHGDAGSRVVIVAVGDGAADGLQRTYLTAMRNSHGHLQLDLWQVPLDGKVFHLDQARGKEIEEARLAVTGLGPDDHHGSGMAQRLVVAARLPGGSVEIQDWSVSVDTRRISPPIHAVPIGKAKRIATPVLFRDDSVVLLAAADESGDLALGTADANIPGAKQSLHSAARPISHLATCQATQVASAAGDGTLDDVMATAVRNGGGHLQLTLWRRRRPGTELKRDDDQTGELVQDIAVASVVGGGARDKHNVVVTAARTPNDELKVTAWRVPDQPNRFFSLFFTELICHRATDDRDGADEPYAVFAVFFPFSPDRSRSSHSDVFRNVDGTPHHSIQHLRQPVNLMSSSGQSSGRIDNPDEVVILVGLMESDDSNVGKVVNTAFTKAGGAVKTQFAIGAHRDDLVLEALQAFRTGLRQGAHVDGIFDSDDELIAVQELRLHQADLDAINAGHSARKVLKFRGGEGGGSYDLVFELAAPFLPFPPD